MKGRNLFESSGVKIASAQPDTAVFISHSRYDKAEARKLAQFLVNCGIDIYFDETDNALQKADEKNDHQKVVRCIEDGLNKCSHLIGIITENTKKSWWVPYEIGGATARTRKCAHLIDGKVRQLPSFIKVATILTDQVSVRGWLDKVPLRKATVASTFLENINRIQNFSGSASLLDFLPENRAISDIVFTPE